MSFGYKCLIESCFWFYFIVPPSVPVIYNAQMEPIESRAGPYEESGELTLECVVMGGKQKSRRSFLFTFFQFIFVFL